MSLKIQINQNDEVTVEEESAGNPNYVETIEGTLANPWGSLNPISILEEVRNNDATIFLTFLNIVAYFQSGLNGIYFLGAAQPFTSSSIGIQVAACYYTGYEGAFNFAWSHESTSFIPVENDTPCTLTIIHHPLPSGT